TAASEQNDSQSQAPAEQQHEGFHQRMSRKRRGSRRRSPRTPVMKEYQSVIETTSPPARVDSAWNTARSELLTSVKKRTEPSAKAKLAPPVWPLPKAAVRISVMACVGPTGHMKLMGTGVLK